MQSFYRKLQGSMCYDQQAQAKKKEKVRVLPKEQQWTKCAKWKDISNTCREEEKDEDRKRALELPRNVGFWLQRLN